MDETSVNLNDKSAQNKETIARQHFRSRAFVRDLLYKWKHNGSKNLKPGKMERIEKRAKKLGLEKGYYLLLLAILGIEDPDHSDNCPLAK